jgi:hypothetical protein
MPMRKIIAAMVLSFIVLMAGRYLIHEVWLSSDYRASSDVFRIPQEVMRRFWIFPLSALSMAVAAVLIYVRGVEAKPWLGQGIRFGILIALLTALPQSLAEYAVYAIHHQLAVKWIFGEGLLTVVLGLVIAAICQPARSNQAPA